MRRLFKDQKGFTLIEMIITIAIAGIIGGAATLAVHQVITIPTISNNHHNAINQVRNAVHWISRDAVMANTVNDSPPGGEFLELTWDSWDGSSHNCTYSLLNSSNGLKNLWRNYDGQQTMIAQYIDPDNTDCDWDMLEGILAVNVTAQVGDETEKRSFEVQPRPID